MKKTILFGLMIALIAIMSYGVYGAIACTTSSDDGTTLTGNAVFNATLTGATSPTYNATTPVLYGRCVNAGSGNSTYVKLVNATDATVWTNGTAGADGLTLNVTWNSIGFEDAPDCDFYFVLSNITQGTNELTCSATATTIVDNTVPTTLALTYDDDSEGTTSNSFISKETILGLDDIVYSAVDFTTVTDACLIYFNNDIYTMTEGTSSASYTMVRGIPSDRMYPTLKVTCTDGTNTSTSTIYTDIEVDSIKEGAGTSDGYAVNIAKDVASKKIKATGIIALVAVGIWFFFVKKK
jgi:hypothetical protein